jgi:hypothetical protein
MLLHCQDYVCLLFPWKCHELKYLLGRQYVVFASVHVYGEIDLVVDECKVSLETVTFAKKCV